jgi:hypothetical protein
MRVAQPIVLDEETRRKLERQARGRSTAARAVLRSKIVLLASDGLQNKQIASTLQVAPRMVTLWRGRFLESGYLLDATRPKLLWFYKFCKRNRLNLNCLLRQSIEQFAA